MKKVGLLFFLVLLLGTAWLAIKYLPQIEIATGYAAKNACSSYFQGRELEDIKAIDLASSPLNLVEVSLDKSKAEVTATLLGLKPKTAIYRRGLGCTLLQGQDDFHIERHSFYKDKKGPSSTLIPQHSLVGIDKKGLDKVKQVGLDKEGEWLKQTTSLLIVQNDSLVAEYYAADFDSESEILGWSMTKSVCNLLIGMMVKDQLISVDDKNLFPAWENDKRKDITLAHLLKMNSGLLWQEEYSSISDITNGLFMQEDIVSYAREKELESSIGSKWEYSSGTTNLISGVMKRRFESYQDYLDYPHEKLFKPLGIQHATMETDESGNYIMSSYMYAKARDWAKLGMLYLNQGNWQGEQLIDSSYISWSLSSAAEADPNYGAQIWLNAHHKDYPSAPESAYKFSGYNGQDVVVIPSMELVVVRTGLSKGPPFDMDAVLKEVINIWGSQEPSS